MLSQMLPRSMSSAWWSLWPITSSYSPSHSINIFNGQAHIKKNEVSHACYYHLCALRHNRPAITAEEALSSARGSTILTQCLRCIFKEHTPSSALARCVVDSKLHRGSNALLQQLHWLPIQYRIKILKLDLNTSLWSIQWLLNLVGRVFVKNTLPIASYMHSYMHNQLLLKQIWFD